MTSVFFFKTAFEAANRMWSFVT